MDRNGHHACHGPKTESDHEDQREHDPRDGPAEFQEAPHREAQPWRRRGIFSGEKVDLEIEKRLEQFPDVTDYDELSEHPQPFPPAPEPFANIGPDPGAVLES